MKKLIIQIKAERNEISDNSYQLFHIMKLNMIMNNGKKLSSKNAERRVKRKEILSRELNDLLNAGETI